MIKRLSLFLVVSLYNIKNFYGFERLFRAFFYGLLIRLGLL